MTIPKSTHDKLLEATRAHLEQLQQRALLSVLTGGAMTSQTQEPEAVLTVGKLEGLLGKMATMKAAEKRTRFRFQVEHGRSGPMIRSSSEAEGTLVECNYEQAASIHQDVHPLVLDEIVSPETAIFRPAHSFDQLIPVKLPRPPYEMPVNRFRSE